MNKKTAGIVIITIFSLIAGAVFFITRNAEALNTYSIDFERDSSQFLSISDGSQTGLDISGDMTIEAWIKLESLPDGTTNDYTIAGKWTDPSNRSYRLVIPFTDNTQLRFSVSSNGSTITNATSSSVLATSTWTHVAAAYDASAGEVQFYINGSPSGSPVSGLATSVYNGSGAFHISALYDGSEYFKYFDGLIDDVRIWNIARTATEISDDMSRELNGNETGLISYWKLNNSLDDSDSDNNNTLTNNGSAAFSASTPFTGFTETLKVRKLANQSISSSETLENDDELKLSLNSNKTYLIDGVIFASSTSATPDISIGFFGQTDVDIAIGYTNDVNEMVLQSGEESNRINLPANTPTSIHIHGTVKTEGTSGDFQLKWAQATSNSASTTVMKGSYLRAEEL